jgi:hypothetical protein
VRGFVDFAPELLVLAQLLPARVVGSQVCDGFVRLVIEADELPGQHCRCIVAREDGRQVTLTLQAVE